MTIPPCASVRLQPFRRHWPERVRLWSLLRKNPRRNPQLSRPTGVNAGQSQSLTGTQPRHLLLQGRLQNDAGTFRSWIHARNFPSLVGHRLSL